jgi:hypothetical protein
MGGSDVASSQTDQGTRDDDAEDASGSSVEDGCAGPGVGLPARREPGDRHVPPTAAETDDPEVQAVIDRYETLLDRREAVHERRLEERASARERARRRGPLARLRRWLDGLF